MFASPNTTAANAKTLVCLFGWSIALLIPAVVGIVTEFRSDLAPVAGRLLVNGEAPVGATIRFHAVEPRSLVYFPPTAVVGEQGDFRVYSLARRDGAAAGSYVATIHYHPWGWSDSETSRTRHSNSFPQRFADRHTSPLRIQVLSGQMNRPSLSLRCDLQELLNQVPF